MLLEGKKTKKVRRARLTQDVITLEKLPTEAAATGIDNQLQESLDCPDCSDMMLQLYDWDKMGYLCENCGLAISNPAILSTYVISGVRT